MKWESSESIQDTRENFQTFGSSEAREKVFKYYYCTEKWAVLIDVMIDEFPNYVAKDCLFNGRRICKQNITQNIRTLVDRFFGINFLSGLSTFKNKAVMNDVKNVVG